MGTPLKVASKSFPTLSPGNYVAVCTQVVYLGKQAGSGGYEDAEKLWLGFELPGEKRTYRKNGVTIETSESVGDFFTVLLTPKSKLRAFLTGWLGPLDEGGAVDLEALLDRVCLLTITNRATTDGSKVTSAAPLPKEMDASRFQRTQDLLYYEPDNSSPEAYAALPEWMRKKIAARIVEKPQSPTKALGAPAGDFDEDIPF